MTISMQEYKEVYEFLAESYVSGRITEAKFHELKLIYSSQLPTSDAIQSLRGRMCQVDRDIVQRAHIHRALGAAQSAAISAHLRLLETQVKDAVAC